jgi:hypothetical protein
MVRQIKSAVSYLFLSASFLILYSYPIRSFLSGLRPKNLYAHLTSFILSILIILDHVARMGEKRNLCRLLVGKPEGKRPLGRPRRRWVDNIRMYLGEVEWGDVDWTGLAQDRNRWRALVNSVLNLRVP